MAIGNPCSCAKASTSSAPPTGPGVPATSGAPTSRAILRACTLSPSRSMVSGDGPIQVRPASITARAKPALSDRNP
ncbi:hypothetical protein G6F31_021898 [Rhizopus arrhizus]|nr:hypothetical protein G6F31_021898 [Rhizopus arrhizus]